MQSDFMSNIFILEMSAIQKKGFKKIFNLTNKLIEKSKKKYSTSQLNKHLREFVKLNSPPSVRGRQLKFKHVHFGGTFPTTFIVHANQDKKIPQNLNIEQVPQFNSNFDELYNELHKIGSRVLSVIALSLGLDSDYFSSWVEKGNSLLRSIHYPPVESLSNPHRARAHEDINLITLLIGAEEGGLEVLNKDGSWIKVEPSSEAIVCNIGDMMQLVTDKKLKSTTHRVMQDTDTEPKSRYSIPFFLHPAPSINLKSIFRDDDEGILADTFLDKRLKEIKLY